MTHSSWALATVNGAKRKCNKQGGHELRGRICVRNMSDPSRELMDDQSTANDTPLTFILRISVPITAHVID